MDKPISRAQRNGLTATGRAPLNERGDDLYETLPEAVQALLRVEKLPEIIWEPACGPGSIVTTLRAAGHKVYATDLVDYGCDDSENRVDFLMEQAPSFYIGAIVTNPPYKLANEFVIHALTLAPKVMMLLRLAFLEGARRSVILDGGQLARVHVFRNRLPRMHRAGWEGKQSSSSIAFAWFIWGIIYMSPFPAHFDFSRLTAARLRRRAGVVLGLGRYRRTLSAMASRAFGVRISVIAIRPCDPLKPLVASMARIVWIARVTRLTGQFRYGRSKRSVAAKLFGGHDRHVAFHRLVPAVITDTEIAGVTEPTGVNANVQLGLLPRVADVGSALRAFT